MDLVCIHEGVEIVNYSYSQAATRHDICDGVRERDGRNCNVMIKRHRRSLGYESGFGPLENSETFLSIACLSR